MDSPLKILIVDDEQDIIIESKEIFEKKGYIAFAADDADKGFELFQKERPQICILDIHMSKSRFDGIKLLEQIRTQDKNCICIMLTRLTDKGRLEDAKRLCANRYILKPINYPELLGLIEDAAKSFKTGA